MKDHSLSIMITLIATAWAIAIFGYSNTGVMQPLAAQIVWGLLIVSAFIIRAIEDLPHDR